MVLMVLGLAITRTAPVSAQLSEPVLPLTGLSMSTATAPDTLSTLRYSYVSDPPLQDPPLHWHSMVTNLPHDWARFAQLTFRPENIPGALAIIGVTGVLIATDDATWQWSHRKYVGSPQVKRASDIFEFVGDGRPQFGLAAAFGAFGFLAGDQRALRAGSQTVEVILACGAVVQVLKHMTGRQSPFVSTRPGGVWDFFPNQIEYHKHVPHFDAYPSGHIATTLATVTVVAENYPEWWWVRPVGYALTAALGVSMVNTGIHWYSDYPLGLFIGYTFGMIVAHPEAVVSSTQGDEFSFAPIILPDGAGFSLMLRI